MASLRDLLEKQKAERAAIAAKGNTNGQVVVGQIVQPQTVQKTIPKEDEQKTQNVASGNASDATAPIAASTPGAITAGNAGTVVEQGLMPEGLSAIQQLKWKKQHGQINKPISGNAGTKPQQSINAASVENNVSREPGPQAVQAQPASNAVAVAQEKINAPAPVASLSQTTDAQKTNDGSIDTTALRTNLDYLANNIENKELVGQVVRTIAVQLKNSPELGPYMSHADMNLIVRGARAAFATQARKKSAAKDEKEKKKGQSDDVMAMFKAAGLDGLQLKLK